MPAEISKWNQHNPNQIVNSNALLVSGSIKTTCNKFEPKSASKQPVWKMSNDEQLRTQSTHNVEVESLNKESWWSHQRSAFTKFCWFILQRKEKLRAMLKFLKSWNVSTVPNKVPAVKPACSVASANQVHEKLKWNLSSWVPKAPVQ